MPIIATLIKEHRMFEGLAERLERSLILEETLARSELRDTLLVLVPALERHEELEALAFHEPSEALTKTEAQHRLLEQLRGQTFQALQASDAVGFPALKDLVRRLTSALREHFATEEKLLFPTARPSSRRAVQAQVERMEKDIQEYWREIEDYLKSPAAPTKA